MMSAFALTAQANLGADGGGGGGGFCFENRKCVTLAETGFRLQESQIAAPVISIQLINEVETVIDLLPIRASYKQEFKSVVFGTPGVFQKVLSYDPKGLAKIRKEYSEILDSNNVSSKQFIIYAVSNFTKTYLLPEFDQLNLRSQALILIHEGIVRRSGSFMKALKIDGLILDALNGQPSAEEIVFHFVSSNSGYADNHLKNAGLFEALMTYVEKLSAKNNSNYIRSETLLMDMIRTTNANHYYPGNYPNAYCLSAKHEAIYYQKHSILWKLMSEAGVSCFIKTDPIYIKQVAAWVDTITVEACNKVGSGEVLIPTEASGLVGVNCQNSKPVSVYNLDLKKL